LPVIIGNVINAIISHGANTFQNILFNSIFISILLLQNIFTHTLFIKYLSRANRSIEHNLRFAWLTNAGYFYSTFTTALNRVGSRPKYWRDAESVEILSRQLANVGI
jgi:ATP-binding cassette subfamily B protein